MSDQKRKDEIFERLKKVIISILKIMREKDPEKRPELNMDTDLIENLGVDSLESIDLMNAIEEEFDVSPNLNEANYRTKISQIVDYIIELQNEKGLKG